MEISSLKNSDIDQCVVMHHNVQGLSIEDGVQPELIDYMCQRYPIWDIHRFVEQVLATDSPGFLVDTNNGGRVSVRELSLARYYKLIRSFIYRVPSGAKPSPLIALFLDCCTELGVIHGFARPGDRNEQGVSEAERYNALLQLIREKASTVKRYIDAKKYSSDYDKRMFHRLQKYVDELFLTYSKLLVVRLDLEYLQEFVDYITLNQAQQDISRFVSHRRWSKLFEHCVGFIVAREHGDSGCGFHFHCVLFFNGQKRHQDINIGKSIGKRYWEESITRISGEGDTLVTRGRHFNCNAKQNEYRYLGVGMISYSDEVKRSNLLYSLIYLAKNDQSLEGLAPPKTKTITRGALPRARSVRRGASRKFSNRGGQVFVTSPSSFPVA